VTHLQPRVKIGFRIHSIRVEFVDGETWERGTRFVIPAGGRTREISVPKAPCEIKGLVVRGRWGTRSSGLCRGAQGRRQIQLWANQPAFSFASECRKNTS